MIKKLGAMKLEYILNKFVALGPKVYGGVRTDETEFTKVKGFKEGVSLSQLETLLNQPEGSSTELSQEKWFKHMESGDISYQDMKYTLRATATKRRLVFESNRLVSTSNIVVNDNSNVD